MSTPGKLRHIFPLGGKNRNFREKQRGWISLWHYAAAVMMTSFVFLWSVLSMSRLSVSCFILVSFSSGVFFEICFHFPQDRAHLSLLSGGFPPVSSQLALVFLMWCVCMSKICLLRCFLCQVVPSPSPCALCLSSCFYCAYICVTCLWDSYKFLVFVFLPHIFWGLVLLHFWLKFDCLAFSLD